MMNTSAEAADQIVRMSLNSAEVALRVSGKGAKEMAKLLYKMMKDLNKETHKTKGQMRLSNLIKSGKKLEIYQLSDNNVKKFCQEAKKYGMVYTILKDRNAEDGITEIMVKSDDRQKINRIYEKLNLAPDNFADVRPDISKNKDEKQEPERTNPPKSKEDEFLDELLAKPNPTKEDHTQNPTQARTTMSSQSVPSSEKTKNPSKAEYTMGFAKSNGKPSVRKELNDIKAELEKQRNDKLKETPAKVNEHKHIKKKKDKER